MRKHVLMISVALCAATVWCGPLAVGQDTPICPPGWFTWIGYCADTPECLNQPGESECVAFDTGGTPFPDDCYCKVTVYKTNCEPPQVFGSPAGLPLTGQAGWYLPVAGSAEFMVYTYPGNTLGIVEYPLGFGGMQFVAGTAAGGTANARVQHDVALTMGTYLFIYDVAVVYSGPVENNLGSFALQPSTASRAFIHLASWVNLSDPTQGWQAYYLVYDAAGVQVPQPGSAPGPEWAHLQFNRWYRFMTKVDFVANKVTWVHIGDLEGNMGASAHPTNWYLGGGATGGGLPVPTGIRLFAGGTVGGNTFAADNISVLEAGEQSGAGDGDLNCDGVINAFDIDAFVKCLTTGTPTPPCPDCQNADVNDDGVINAFDIDPFVVCLTTGNC